MAKVCLILASFLLAVVAVSSVDIVCPTEQSDLDIVVQFPSKTNCSEFYKCDRGVAVLQWCPDGLHYSTWHQACDYPETAKCAVPQK